MEKQLKNPKEVYFKISYNTKKINYEIKCNKKINENYDAKRLIRNLATVFSLPECYYHKLLLKSVIEEIEKRDKKYFKKLNKSKI
jgi:hypothetical protein